MDSTETLPAGVHSPALRLGFVSGVDSKYSVDGSVQSLNEINTVRFDSDQLSRMDPEVKTLVSVLNQYSQQQLGSQIDLGTLRVKTEPTVRYIAPIYARGISENHTLAVATPIVFYQNKLTLTQSASNVDAICGLFGPIRQNLPELDDACRRLNVRVTDAARQELARKGFKPLENRNETVFGDAQLVSLWRFHERGNRSLLLRTTLTLPTGQRNDPDDLADLGVFGYTALEPMVLANLLVGRRLRFALKGGYKWMVPDSVEMRVPSDAGDVIPGAETKERLSRRAGGTLTMGGAANWNIFDSILLAGGYEMSTKSRDSFRGSRAASYDLLSRGSDTLAHRLRAGITYDTISLYKKTGSVPPLKLDFEVINTIAGRNTERQLVNELSLTMFF